jgi:tetratricopeptide (TPR) repeat protein
LVPEVVLVLYPALKDSAEEAATFSNIGAVYDALSEKQKALDYFQQALSLSRAMGDRINKLDFVDLLLLIQPTDRRSHFDLVSSTGFIKVRQCQ